MIWLNERHDLLRAKEHTVFVGVERW
jgi:hypothetical protein